MKIYEGLSQVYDTGWGGFAEAYAGLIGKLLDERGITQAKVLDVACGTGILAILLAKQGHTVHGLDISPEMIAVARSKSAGTTNVSFAVQDMTKFEVPDKYDLVTCTYDSLNYLLNIDDVKATFSRVASALRKSGIFIFDSNTNPHYIRAGNRSQKQELNGISFVQTWSYDVLKKEAVITFEFAGGKEVHRQRPYDLAELNPILVDNGFRVVQTYSYFDRRPYNNASFRLYCVAEKDD